MHNRNNIANLPINYNIPEIQQQRMRHLAEQYQKFTREENRKKQQNSVVHTHTSHVVTSYFFAPPSSTLTTPTWNENHGSDIIKQRLENTKKRLFIMNRTRNM